MDYNYAPFVAFASLQAYDQLQRLLSKWKTEVTPDILADAARFGQQRAMEKFFPGLPKVPFERPPLQDILEGLKLQYNIVAPIAIDESSRRASVESSSRRLVENVHTPVTGQFRIPVSSRTDSFVESRLARRESGVIELPEISPEPSQESSARRTTSSDRIHQEVTPRPDMGEGGEDTARVYPTKLRTVRSAPVFPWEKKKE